MSEVREYRMDDPFIEDLFFKEWAKLVRYTKIQLRRYGSNVLDHDGRAEEIVQELFYTLCKKADEVKKSESPEKWLYNTVYYKIKENLREDRKWTKCLSLLPVEEVGTQQTEIEEMESVVIEDDYLLLKRLYVEGYTYKELCAELGCTKSCLAMRVHREKMDFKKKYEKIFENK